MVSLAGIAAAGRKGPMRIAFGAGVKFPGTAGRGRRVELEVVCKGIPISSDHVHMAGIGDAMFAAEYLWIGVFGGGHGLHSCPNQSAVKMTDEKGRPGNNWEYKV